MAAVVLENVCKSFGKVDVIKQVHIQIKDGEFVVFVGPSGCGKSTLLRLIAGLEELTTGEIFIDDVNVSQLPPSLRDIAMVFQSYALYPHMTVAENMGFGLKLKHFPAQEIASRVQSAARILQIDQLLERKPKALSGGQRQRVAIGRAIVTKPKVFLFDEPLSNLDAALRVQMRIELSKLHRELKTTIIYVTHDQIEAMTLANKIVVLNSGRVEQIGSPMDVYLYPDNKFVAGFIGSPKMNFINATLDEATTQLARVSTPSGTLRASVDASKAKPGDQVTLGIRPEHCQLKLQEGMDCFQGEVLLVEHLGDETLTYLQVEGAEENVIVREEGEYADVKVGDLITVGVPQRHCHLFDTDGSAFTRLQEEDTT